MQYFDCVQRRRYRLKMMHSQMLQLQKEVVRTEQGIFVQLIYYL